MQVDAATGVVDQDFLRSGASSSHSESGGVAGGMSESVSAACEVCRASEEVIRAFAATRNAIALRRAATGGKSESRSCGHKLEHMLPSMRRQFAQ